MLKRVCLAILLLLSVSSQVRAAEILAVLSSPAEPYLVARKAFEQHFNTMAPGRGLKTIQPHIIRSVTLTQDEQDDALGTAVVERRPDFIVALGSRALSRSVQLPGKIPVIYLLVPSPEKFCLPTTRPPAFSCNPGQVRSSGPCIICYPPFSGWGWSTTRHIPAT